MILQFSVFGDLFYQFKLEPRCFIYEDFPESNLMHKLSANDPVFQTLCENKTVCLWTFSVVVVDVDLFAYHG